jgi:hypothetical protein
LKEEGEVCILAILPCQFNGIAKIPGGIGQFKDKFITAVHQGRIPCKFCPIVIEAI